MNNSIVVASAGGRKTTYVVEEALANTDGKTLITTFTLENLRIIRKYLVERNGVVPKHIDIQSWFTFLLREGVRPYQNRFEGISRVASIDFNSKPTPFVKKTDPAYYVNRAGDMYMDRVSDFVCQCNDLTGGLVIRRMESVYDRIYVDEIQDLSGWDQSLLELLLDSRVRLTMVGDPRQATYSTNRSLKNKAYKGSRMFGWIEKVIGSDKCTLEERNRCFRCNQEICDFADGLFPDWPATTSESHEHTGHDGVFKIGSVEVGAYVSKYNPVVLRWNKTANTQAIPAMNFGQAKGSTFDRVLIFPTKPMENFLKTGAELKAEARCKLYVGITRARYSVAFVVNS